MIHSALAQRVTPRLAHLDESGSAQVQLPLLVLNVGLPAFEVIERSDCHHAWGYPSADVDSVAYGGGTGVRDQAGF